jgi:hypothetical protein
MTADKWQTLSQRSSYKYISEYTIHIVINIILIQNFLRLMFVKLWLVILLNDILPIYAYGVFFIFIYTHLPVTMCLLRKAFPHHSKYWSVKRLVKYKCPWRLLHQLWFQRTNIKHDGGQVTDTKSKELI